jgi:hypothetical protein
MRSSLFVLAVVMATLHLVRTALVRRRGVLLVPTARRGRAAALGVSELRLPERATDGGPAEMGRRRGRKGVAVEADATSSRFAEWRYYGFRRNHDADADAAVAEPEIVAGAPAVGSVVSVLPDDCVSTLSEGRVYFRCGRVWYQPRHSGSDVVYLVVHAP